MLRIVCMIITILLKTEILETFSYLKPRTVVMRTQFSLLLLCFSPAIKIALLSKAKYLLSKAFRPNVGKFTNPHPSPAVKNHWKKPHRKLKEKNLPKVLTCFLESTRGNEKD